MLVVKKCGIGFLLLVCALAPAQSIVSGDHFQERTEMSGDIV
jgi:hypothetical protein